MIGQALACRMGIWWCWSSQDSLWSWKDMAKQYRSEAFAAIHETKEALHEVGTIDKKTMREFDEVCLTPTRPLKPGSWALTTGD